MADDLAVYIHFPYCKSRCPYCDFFKSILPKSFDEETVVARYSDDLARMRELCGKRKVKTVFFGGGTPSLLSPDAVGRVLEAVDNCFGIKSDAEITLEANPNSFEQEKFIGFRTAGVNRLSLGVQALNEQDLRFLGRTHGVVDALLAMELCSRVFERFSVDLIYSRPEQRFDIWKKEIDIALEFNLKHISLYQLTIEEGTVFQKKKIKLPDEETSLDFYNKTIAYLRSKGLERYEVSNFAKSGEESRHNLVYWHGGDYIGIGEGAHGRIHLDDGRILATVDGKISETLTAAERAEELVMMGLRIKDGLNAERFYEACGLKLFDFLSKKMTKELAEINLLCYDDANLKLTDKGFVLLDEVIYELLS